MTDPDTDPNQARGTLGAASQVAVRTLYFNGFDVGATLSDVGLLTLLNGQPQVRLSMSFTTAKTLCAELSALISEFESATSHSIMTMSEVRAGYDQMRRGDEKK
jgi:hypothetical protein